MSNIERMSGINRLLRRSSILHGKRSCRPLTPFERRQLDRLKAAIGPYFAAQETPEELKKHEELTAKIHYLQHKLFPRQFNKDGSWVKRPRPFYPK